MAVTTAMVAWWVLLQAVSGQSPSLTFRYEEWHIGSFCRGPNYVEGTQPTFILGSRFGETPRGVVAHYLLNEAMSLGRDSEFYTSKVPWVKIVKVKQTCASRYIYVNSYNTFAALIKYTCRGIACRQRANETRIRIYQHLFSFVCSRYTGQPGLVTELPRFPHYVLYVDRNPPNSIVTTITAPFSSCELCRILPPKLRNENYDPATGCNSKFP